MDERDEHLFAPLANGAPSRFIPPEAKIPIAGNLEGNLKGRELGPLFTVPEDGQEPAFPVNGATGWYRGMTLRDYFAAQAMQAYLEKATIITATNSEKIEWIVGNSYRIAEAMMQERAKDND